MYVQMEILEAKMNDKNAKRKVVHVPNEAPRQ
jgi:hypothetical protein